MKNILIIRLSALGDVVFASPLIAAIREKHPESRISWLVEPPGRDLIIDNPQLDEVIIWPKSSWKRLLRSKQYRQLWQEIRLFRKNLRQKNFDVVLDLQGLMKSAIWAYVSGAKRRVGLGSREGSAKLMHEVISRVAGDNTLISSEYRNMAQHLGLRTAPFPMQVAISDTNQRSVQNLIQEHALEKGFIALCPFTTRPQKHWIESYWVTLIEQLQSTYNIPVVILGGPADIPAAEQLGQTLDLISLCGKTNLQEAAGVIRESDMVIGVDTGLTHIAIAMERATICIFGSTQPYKNTENPRCIVIDSARSCSPCRRSPSCDDRFDCMTDITPALVMHKATSLIPIKEQ